MASDLSDFQYYKYSPSMAAAVIFIILFLSATGLHIYQMARTRIWFFIPFILGGIFEAVGYIGRAASANETPNWTLGPYLIQSLFLLVAPAMFAASTYMILGRIIMARDGEKHSIIRPRLLTKLFVTCDILSFLTQGSGGGLMSAASLISVGENIVVAGLFIQIIGFGLFVLVAIMFHIRLIRSPTTTILSRNIPWERHIYALYTTSILIFVRSIVRVAEYIQGFNGYILHHEYFLYIFDATLMFLVMATLAVVHPSEITACLRGGNVIKSLWKTEHQKPEGGQNHPLQGSRESRYSNV